MSTKKKITVHQALAELKTIDNRITKKINEGTYVCSNKHSNEKINGMTIKQFMDDMKASYQSVEDLIRYRNAMKRAVVLSNATTKVNIDGWGEFSVAEIIDMKNHGMEHYTMLLYALNRQNGIAASEIARNSGEAIEKRAEQHILAVIQAQPKDSKMSVDSDAMKSLRAEYIKNNTYDLLDPINVKEIMKELEDKIDKFKTDADAALSVSNALTTIEFEY